MDDGTFVIMGFVHGLGPNPLHGFHIHEFGNLSDDDCASCGDSFYDLGNFSLFQKHVFIFKMFF